MIETAMRDRRTEDHVLVIYKDRGVAAADQPATVPAGERLRGAVRVGVRALAGALRAVLTHDATSARIEAGEGRSRVEIGRHLLALGLLR